MAYDLKLLYSLSYIYQLCYAAISHCNTPITFHRTTQKSKDYSHHRVNGILQTVAKPFGHFEVSKKCFDRCSYICNIYEAIHVQTFVLQNLTNCTSVKYHFKCLGFWTCLNVNEIRIWNFFFFVRLVSGAFRDV